MCGCSLIGVVKIYASLLEATAVTATTTTTRRLVETREGGKVHSYTIAEFTFSWKRDIKSNSHNVDSQQQPQRYQQQTQQHKWLSFSSPSFWHLKKIVIKGKTELKVSRTDKSSENAPEQHGGSLQTRFYYYIW